MVVKDSTNILLVHSKSIDEIIMEIGVAEKLTEAKKIFY